MRLAFGPMAGRNDALFQSLRSMSLSRDAGAPVVVDAQDLEEFEKRRDMRDLRADFERARRTSDKKAAQSIKSQIENRVKTLSDLKLQVKREEYFERVDSLRAQGLPTTTFSGEADIDGASRKVRSNGALSAVAHFVQGCSRELDEGCSVEQRAKDYMELLVNYLAHRPQRRSPSEIVEVKDCGDAAEPTNEGATDEGAGLDRTSTQSRCLICDLPVRGRSELTRHCQKIHVKNGTFDGPFSCPECFRLGMGNISIEGGPPVWSRHAEETHGRIYAPNLPSISVPTKGSQCCLLCENFFFKKGGGLARHLRRTHDQKDGIFKQIFPCPECCRQGKSDAYIDGLADWKQHISLAHEESEGLRPPSRSCSPDISSNEGYQQESSGGKRKRDEFEPPGEHTAASVGGDWLGDTMDTSDTTCISPGSDTDSISGTQTPASSVDYLLQRIDPRLLLDRTDPDRKKVKSNPLDDLETGDHNCRLSSWTTDPGPVFGGLEGTGLEDLGTDCHLSTSLPPQVHSLSLTGPISLDVEPVELMTVRLPSQVESNQPLVQDEKEMESSWTPASADSVDLRSDVAELWGRGYALAPEGCELNRVTNNAQRRDEISSNISSEHVITGKRLRTSKRNDS